jgi:multiple sugar transport system substrate-binding protein
MIPKQSHFKKIGKVLILVLGISLLSAGCGGGGGGGQSQKQVVLTFWKPFEESQNLQPVFQAFQKKYPNIRIDYVTKNIDTYEQDLLDALASGNGPDIFSINNGWLPKYQDKLAPATSTIFSLKEFKDAFVDVAVKDFTLNNQIYAVPLSVDSLALYYNKDLLGTAGIATPPKTWTELSADAQKIKRSDSRGYFTRSGVAMGTNSNVNRAADILYLLMLQQGAAPASNTGQPSFADSVQKNGGSFNPGAEALGYYTSFANPASPNYNWNLRSDYSIDAFANGRAAFLYSYSYTWQTLLSKNANLNFDVAPVPQPNLDDPAVNFANYWGEGVSKQSKNQQAAWTFLKYLSSKEALDIYYAQNKQPSSRKDLIAQQIQDPEIGVFANANLTAKAFYRQDQAKMDSIFGKMIDNIILNGMDVRQALADGQRQVQIMLRPQ